MKGRRVARPEAEQQVRLEPQEVNCRYCGEWMPVAYHAKRKILTVNGLIQLRLVVRRCHNPGCQAYKQPYRPEEEGRWALPHGECGLDLIALVGRLRYREQRSALEIQRILTCAKPPSRSTKRIGMPRRNSKNRSEACVPSNEPSKPEPMPRRTWSTITAWQSEPA